MKKRLLILLALWGMCAASLSADTVDDLLGSFAKQTNQAGRVEVANRLMKFLGDNDFADGLYHFDLNYPPDTVEHQVVYWGAEWFYDQQQYEKATPLALRAYELSRGTPGEADCLSLVSLVYFRQSKYEEAVKYAKLCYQLDEKSGDPDAISSSLNTIAGIYIGANQPAEAEHYILKAIGYAQKAGNPARLAVLEGMASEVYHAMKNDAEALNHINIACDIERELGDNNKLWVRLTQKASVLLGLNKSREAEQILRPVIDSLGATGNRHSMAIACNKMGRALIMQNRDKEAVPYFRRAAAVFQEMGDLANEMHSRYGLYESLWKLNPDSAKLENDRFLLLKDSLYNTASAESLARFNAEFGTDWLKKENDRQHSLIALWVGIALAIALIAIGVVLFMRRKLKVREAALQAIIRELRAMPAVAESAPTQTSAPEKEVVAKPAAEKPAAGELSESEQEFLAKLVATVKENMARGITVEELASQMFLSRSQLNRRVKAITGVPTQQYVMRIRLEHARILLNDNPQMTMSEVAFACGFGDAAGFTRAFKQTFGAPPSQFRTS